MCCVCGAALVSRHCSLRSAILLPLEHKVGTGVDIILRLPDRLTTNSVEKPSRVDQRPQSQRCRIRPILAANG